MEDLDQPFQWVIAGSSGATQELWRFHYGAWLAGSGNTDAAIALFSAAQIGVAKAMLARLLKAKGDNAGAQRAYGEITEKWLLLHPQVVVERDQVLRAVGPATIPEREKWLTAVDALKDEWIAERRVQLLIDKGQFASAKELLLSTDFQKVHQTYSSHRPVAARSVRSSRYLASRYPANSVKTSWRASAPIASTTSPSKAGGRRSARESRAFRAAIQTDSSRRGRSPSPRAA